MNSNFDNEDDDSYPVPILGELPFNQKLSLPAPTVMAPKVLNTRLLRDLSFPEKSAVFRVLDKCNFDMFSCFPANERLYENSKLLSQNPSDVLEAAEETLAHAPRTFTTSVDINAHGEVPLPEVPESAEDLPKYVSDVQTYFLAELEAREASYAKLFMQYCAAIALYVRREAIYDSRESDCPSEENLTERIKNAIVESYYREAASIAKVIFAHMYTSVCRETARRLAATQSKRKDIFVQLKYEWNSEKQFQCLFHPVIQNHGVSTVAGNPVTSKMMRQLNDVRTSLGLYPIRFGLLELPGEKITEKVELVAQEPRGSFYLSHKILQKLKAFENKRSCAPRRTTEVVCQTPVKLEEEETCDANAAITDACNSLSGNACSVAA